MELENHTSYPAMLYRTALPEKDGVAQFAAAVIARITYELTEWGVVPSNEQTWPVSVNLFDGPQGPMDGDQVFKRDGVDLFVFGHARPAGGRPVKKMLVELRVQELRYSTLVFGDRTWMRAGNGLVASEPSHFTAMPLTATHAFGGTDEWDGLQVAHPDNPVGRGFAVEETAAIGKPLPNIEDPSQLLQRWDDSPPVALWTPLPFASRLRLQRGVNFGPQGQFLGLKPRFYNAAPNGLIAPQLHPGDKIEIDGVSEKGRVTIELPPNNLKARLRFGDRVAEQPLQIDQVGMEIDQKRMFMTFRYPFKYSVREFTKRVCELLPR